MIVHVRPVIIRTVIVHRTHAIVRDVVRREVRGVKCNCDYSRRSYRDPVVSYRH